MRGQYPPVSEHYSQELKRLIDNLLHLDPTQRPSVNRIMAQPVMINSLLDLSTDIGRVPYKLYALADVNNYYFFHFVDVYSELVTCMFHSALRFSPIRVTLFH